MYQLPGKDRVGCALEIHRESVDALVIFRVESPLGSLDQVEALATQILHDFHLRVDYVTWMAELESGCYRINFSWDGERFYAPQWKKIHPSILESKKEAIEASWETRVKQFPGWPFSGPSARPA